MTRVGCKYAWSVVATATACLALTLSLSAQVQTQTTTATGKPTVVTKVERGEVVTVSGNDLVVKMADGTIRHFQNVPESAQSDSRWQATWRSRSEARHEAPANYHYHINSHDHYDRTDC